MNPKTHRIQLFNMAVTTRTPRRFIVVAVRPKAVTNENGTYVAFAEVIKRTDSHVTAEATVRRYGRVWGAFAVVYDTETREFSSDVLLAS